MSTGHDETCAILSAMEQDGKARFITAFRLLGDDPRTDRAAQANLTSARHHLHRVTQLRASLRTHEPLATQDPSPGAA